MLTLNAFVFSQEPAIESTSDKLIFDVKVNKMMGNGPTGASLDLKKVKGSPYLNNDFEDGQVYINSKVKSLGYRLRYNIYTDEFEIFNSEKNKIVALFKTSDYICKIKGVTYKYFSYTDVNANEKDGYFVELLTAKIPLYLKYRSVYHPAQPSDNPLSYDKPASFSTSKDYYLLKDGKMQLLPTKKSKFFPVFGQNQNKIKQFVKKNKLKISKEKDLIKIVQYYNTL